MNTFKIFILLLFLLGIILYIDNKYVGPFQKSSQFKSPNPQQIGINNNLVPNQSVTTTPLPSVTMFFPSPTRSSNVTPTETARISADMQQYIYPGSNIVVRTGESLDLTSSDNPTVVTDWYKNKIKSLGMSVTTFVVTKTNNKILNKLVAANGRMSITIEIKKDSGSPVVNIRADTS